MTDLSPLLLEKLPEQNRPLATVVLTIVLQALVKPPGGGKPAVWRFDLTRADIEKVVDGALAGIAQHPEWLYKDPDHRAMAAAGASLVLDVLSRLRGGDGGLLRTLVRSDCLAPLLSAVLVSNTMEVLEDLKDNNGKPMGPEPIAQAVTEIVAALVERGTSGIERVFTFDALADVMRVASRAAIQGCTGRRVVVGTGRPPGNCARPGAVGDDDFGAGVGGDPEGRCGRRAGAQDNTFGRFAREFCRASKRPVATD